MESLAIWRLWKATLYYPFANRQGIVTILMDYSFQTSSWGRVIRPYNHICKCFLNTKDTKYKTKIFIYEAHEENL